MDGEQKLFELNKQEWLRSHPNQWVWIHESSADFFPSYEEAVQAAYSKGYSNKPIFVRQITEKDAQSSIAGIYRWAV